MPKEDTQFKPGNPGRPKGSRNKLGEAFLSDLQKDWAENGLKALETMRETKPNEYVRVVASILPKELNIRVEDELTDEQLDERIRQLAAVIGIEGGTGEASGGKAEADKPEQAGDVSTVH